MKHKITLFKHLLPNGGVRFFSSDMSKDWATGGINTSNIHTFGICVGEVEGVFEQTSEDEGVSVALEKAREINAKLTEEKLLKLSDKADKDYKKLFELYKPKEEGN